MRLHASLTVYEVAMGTVRLNEVEWVFGSA